MYMGCAYVWSPQCLVLLSAGLLSLCLKERRHCSASSQRLPGRVVQKQSAVGSVCSAPHAGQLCAGLAHLQADVSFS